MKLAISMVAVAITTVIVPLMYLAHKKTQTSKSIGVLKDWASTTDEQYAALNALKGDGSPKTTKALLAILVEPATRPDTRQAIIPILGSRQDPEVPEVLSELLQPHNPLALRRGAVDALKQLDCGSACARNVLHYNERLWRGDVPSELESLQSEDARKEFQEKKAAMNFRLKCDP